MLTGPERARELLIWTLIFFLAALTLFEVHERSHGYDLDAQLQRSRSQPGALEERHGVINARGRDRPIAFSASQDTLRWLQHKREVTSAKCHPEPHAEYGGEVVKWGEDHLQPSAASCCNACSQHEGCQVWVWCAMLSGCGPDRVPLPTGSLGTMGTRKYRECWLKKAKMEDIIHDEGFPHPDVGWTSGSIFPERAALEETERVRLRALRENPSLPLVFLDVSIRGLDIGRIEIVLFKDVAPLAAENFRALCTGEKGIVPAGREGAGQTYSFKGRAFYRIIDRFIDQTGASTESIYGGSFKDDPGGLALKHDRKGLLSMANAGPDSNTSHFSILLGPAPHLDGKYVIFGEIVSGIEVARRINSLARGRAGNTAGADAQAIIIDSGEILR